MGNFLSLIFGPLVVPEVVRSAQRFWIRIIRVLGALVFAGTSLLLIWWWSDSARTDPYYQPEWLIPIGLGIQLVFSVVVSLLLSPAVLAGSLAGEKERGSIGLLLSTRVDAREIVLGRVFGKLVSVGSILLAGLPFLLGFAVLAGMSFGTALTMLALPISIAWGAGGLAIAASAIASKGRNALIGVYSFLVALCLAPELDLIPGLGPIGQFLSPLNPFTGTLDFVQQRDSIAAIPTIETWTILGLIGIALASWQLRRRFLGSEGGRGAVKKRRWRVPAVDERRPMLWKELYIERIGTLGWFGRLLGVLLVLYLGVGSIVLAGVALGSLLTPSGAGIFDRCVGLMSDLYGNSAGNVSTLIQLSVGLRAAVTVASERERGTWDALLTSPLSGGEILRGKLWGSLHAIRALVIATLVAWSLSLAFRAMEPLQFGFMILFTVVGSTYAAALGVRASLICGTATRAMALTVGSWLGGYIIMAIAAGIVSLVFMFLTFMAWLFATQIGLTTTAVRAWIPFVLFPASFMLTFLVEIIAVTGLVVSESRMRFDVIAGRSGDDVPPEDVVAPVAASADGYDPEATLLDPLSADGSGEMKAVDVGSQTLSG